MWTEHYIECAASRALSEEYRPWNEALYALVRGTSEAAPAEELPFRRFEDDPDMLTPCL